MPNFVEIVYEVSGMKPADDQVQPADDQVQPADDQVQPADDQVQPPLHSFSSCLFVSFFMARQSQWAVDKSEWELAFALRLVYGRSPHAYVNQRLQRQLELLMMSGVPLETC
jgi:hypothetical protein